MSPPRPKPSGGPWALWRALPLDNLATSREQRLRRFLDNPRMADRYRNPEEDLPADFDVQRAAYYEALKQPLDVETFIADLQQQMKHELGEFDRTLPKNLKL